MQHLHVWFQSHEGASLSHKSLSEDLSVTLSYCTSDYDILSTLGPWNLCAVSSCRGMVPLGGLGRAWSTYPVASGFTQVTTEGNIRNPGYWVKDLLRMGDQGAMGGGPASG